MIGFVLMISVILYALLVLSFLIRDATIGLIAACSIMVIGVYALIYGIEVIPNNNILSVAYGFISIGLGSYVFISGSVQQIEETM